MQGIGATGAGILGGNGLAETVPTLPPGASNAFYVYATNDGSQYRVLDARDNEEVFSSYSPEASFQRAFDRVSDEGGGTVVASGDTFQFEEPATMGANTALVGQHGTRFVVTPQGQRNSPFPGPDQTNPLSVGHDLIRVRGDNTAVTGITFDANGTQLDNHAIQADEVTGLTIANNRTVGGFNMAISFSGCQYVLARNNIVLGPNWYGITSRAAIDDLDLKRSTDVTIIGNRVAGMKFNNIAPYNVANFTVLGNVVYDGGHSLIACSPAQQGTIAGNVCRNLNRFGGDPGGEAGLEIEYKETHLREAVAGTPQARSYDITIANNHVENCQVGFIARTVPADPEDTAAREGMRSYNFTVTGNAFNDCPTGIRLRSGDTAVVSSNTVRNAETAIDIDDSYTNNLQQGLNATR
jgi:hypothetical protein